MRTAREIALDHLAALLGLMPGDELGDPTVHLPRPAWHAHAACRGVGPAIFFEARYADEAATYCARCPVTVECHRQASDGDEHGTWAGLDRPARRKAEREGTPAA